MNNDSLDDIVSAYSRFVPHQFPYLLGRDSVADIALGDTRQYKEKINRRITDRQQNKTHRNS
jgi:hypothetical protein